jgi:hypothetical protein
LSRWAAVRMVTSMVKKGCATLLSLQSVKM